MQEPDEPKLERPAGGWPGTVLRLEFDADVDSAGAAFELAAASRRLQSGASATFHGIPMVAYPHETVGEIRDRWQSNRMRELGRRHGELPDAGEPRWTADRKLAVLVAIGSGRLTQAEAIERWSLSDDELREWGVRYDVLGPDGLKPTKLQVVGRPGV